MGPRIWRISVEIQVWPNDPESLRNKSQLTQSTLICCFAFLNAIPGVIWIDHNGLKSAVSYLSQSPLWRSAELTAPAFRQKETFVAVELCCSGYSWNRMVSGGTASGIYVSFPNNDAFVSCAVLESKLDRPNIFLDSWSTLQGSKKRSSRMVRAFECNRFWPSTCNIWVMLRYHMYHM